ncbi:MAG: ABC transporter permease [Alphaproteobacteria bacterium]
MNVAAPTVDEAPTEKSRLQRLVRMARRQPLGAISGMMILVMVFVALFAEVISPHDPLKMNFIDQLASPSWSYLLGTDELGRDIFSRIIYGSRTALLIGFVSAFVGATLGLVLGVTSAYLGGWFDLIFQRVMDVFMAFPLIIMALAIVSIFGSGAGNVIIAITIPFVPKCARVVRSSALALRDIPYVDAARASGFSHTRIIMMHMVPNVMAPYLIMVTSFVGQAILLEASLSYLGLGVQEPTAAWGLMLRGGAEQFFESAPWVAIFPGLAITLAVFAFNLFGDSLRDALDPKLRST